MARQIKRIGIAHDSAANGFVARNRIVGRAELEARTDKLGDICTKFKNKFLKTVIFGKFVLSFVLTARNFGALTVHIREIIMTKNSAQRGKIGETLKYGLLVLCMALISACGGGGGGGAISVATPDNGGESGSPTTIESQISSQLSAMEDAIEAADELSDDERADYKSIIEGLRNDLAAKELSIRDLIDELLAIQQQLQEITAALPSEDSCENEQRYIDGSCKNCAPGMEFSFDISECIATESSCGTIEQVYADGECQECPSGTAFSNNECVASESPCENEQYYVDGSCKNCPLGMKFSFDSSQCIATALSCGKIEQVYADGSCEECPLGTKFSDNQCIPTAASCHAKKQILSLSADSCQSCPSGTAFSNNQCITGVLCTEVDLYHYNDTLEHGGCIQADGCQLGTELRDGECVPTTSSCRAIGRVYVDGSCQYCSGGTHFRGGECVTTESSCARIGRVYVDGSCQSCSAGTEFSGNKCIMTAASCHAKGQILAGDDCQACPSDMQFNENHCIPTAASCHANGQVLTGNLCQSSCAVGQVANGFGGCEYCPSGTEINSDNTGCMATASSCETIGQVYDDGNCRECASGMAFINNQCVSISAAEEENLEFCNAHGLQYRTYRSVAGGRCVQCPLTQPALVGNVCTATVEACYAVDSIFDPESNSCHGCGYYGNALKGNVCASNREKTVEICNAQDKILVGRWCRGCPSNTRYRDNQCVPRSEFDTEEYRGGPGNIDEYDDMRLSYAYERGYFGKGVTVALLHEPGYAIDHPDLAANYITASIAGISDFRLTSTMNIVAEIAAGLIGATRNGEGMHGVAPEVKMVPLPGGYDAYKQESVASYLRESNIPIINNGSRHDLEKLSVINDFVGDSDAIWVWSGDAVDVQFAPLTYPRLQTLWVSAIALYGKRHKFLPYSSETCGPAKDWCVATAPKGGYVERAGPHVSGALALLYGALGIESPQMARAILLTTATDLGEPGIDEVYGRGFVNISAAIVMVENMKTAAADGLSAVSFADLRGELPSGFSHLHDELAEVQVAVKLTNGLYYNVALSEMMTPGDDSDVPLGDGATDMLADAESDSRRGFFAYGDIDAELGLRYYGGTGGFSYVAEGQHATTNQRFFAGDFGSLGGVSGKVYSGKVGFVRDMNMAGMQIFGDYERAAVGGDGDEGNLIVGVRDAQAESWMAGLSFGDIWKYGDRIKLSARQEMGLSGGDLIVRYPHAVGDFHETFIGESTQEIEVREAFLPLKQKALMLYTAGYSQKFTAKSEWAAALEYNAGNNAKALSLIWQGEF